MNITGNETVLSLGVKMDNFVKLCEIEIIQQHHANEIRKMLENTGVLKLVCNLEDERFTYEIWIKIQ